MRIGQDIAALPAEPSVLGEWEPAERSIPLPVVHSALIPGGKVLFVGPASRPESGSSACLWDPDTGRWRIWDFPADFSLGGQCSLPDGRLLLAGGRKEEGVVRLTQTYLFDPFMEDWLRVNDMPGRGACPTLVEQGDGRVMAVGGTTRSVNHSYEKSGGWAATASQETDWPLYPQLTLLADGSLFFSGQHFGGRSLINPGLLHPGGRYTELPEEKVPPGFRFALREPGGTVLLPPAQDQRVLVVSGGSPPSPDVYVMDFGADDPLVEKAAALRAGRAGFSTTILPDRTVLVCGGRHASEQGQSAALEAEIYDPITGRWTVGAPARLPCSDTSTSVLLPDGRVLLAGSAGGAPAGEQGVEIYNPPYLFGGPRPKLETAPEGIAFGEPFTVATADADIRWLSLVKPVVSSAGFDPGQRLVDLPFQSKGPGLLQASAPNNANVAPPGWYLMFLVNHAGIPSVGRWVRLAHASSAELSAPMTGVVQPAPSPRQELSDPVSAASGLTAPAEAEETFWGETIAGESQADDFQIDSSPLPPSGETASVAFLKGAPGPQAPETFSPVPAPSPTEERRKDMNGTLSRVAAPAVEPNQALPQETAPQFAASVEEEPLPQPHLESVPESPRRNLGPGWSRWVRPGLVVGSSAVLTLGMVVEFLPLRIAGALMFLLIAPGMAFVGLFRPHDWVTDLGFALGVSIAIETIVSLVMVVTGVWSAERAILVLLGISLVPAAVQLIRAGSGWPRDLTEAGS